MVSLGVGRVPPATLGKTGITRKVRGRQHRGLNEEKPTLAGQGRVS